MTDTFTMDVDQASEIKHAAKRNGLTNADLKALSTGNMFAKILPVLRGRAEVVVKSILELISTVALPATTEKFVASQMLVVNTSNSAKIKIGYIDSSVKPFLSIVEEARKKSKVAVHSLTEDALDELILAERGEKAQIKLSEFMDLIERQGHGQNGDLRTDGLANIVYIDGLDELVLSAFWFAEDGGWFFFACSVRYPLGWRAARRVVSRN